MKETSSQEEAARWRWPAVPCERCFLSLSESQEPGRAEGSVLGTWGHGEGSTAAAAEQGWLRRAKGRMCGREKSLLGPKDGRDIPGQQDRREDFQLLGGNVVKNCAVICFPVPVAGNSLNASVSSKVPGPH